MTVVAPPLSIDPLIAEAKRRARRRRVYLLVVLAIAVAGALTYGLLRGGGPVERATGNVDGASAARLRGVGEVGSSGGVTWAMNGHGLWLTRNGGHAWRKVAIPRGSGFIERQGSYVQFADPQHGWISINELTGYAPQRGQRWIFARTTDGGRTWHQSYPSDCHGRCGGGSMSFLDARHGFLLAYEPGAGTPNELLRTDDGGQTWQPVAKAALDGPITFLDNRIGFAFGWGPRIIRGPYFGPPFGTLYRTTDGGRTWSKYDIGGSTSFVQEPIRIVGDRVVVVQNRPNPSGGLNLAAGTIYVSADGRSWSGSAVPGDPTVLTSFTAVSPNVWAFSSGRDLYTTADAGDHWRRIRLRGLVTHRPQRLWFERVDFTSSQVGWLVLGRTLYGTTDGGVHWAVAGPSKGKPIPVHACDPDRLRTYVWSTAKDARHASAYLEFTNLGRLGCRLSGWPTVVAVTADGSLVRAKRSSLRRPQSIVLGPGRSARAEVHGTGAPSSNGSASCRLALRLRITAPGGHRVASSLLQSDRRPLRFPLCGGLAVTAVFRR